MNSIKSIKPYIMIFPAIVIFLLFGIYPILYIGYLSFHEWNLISPVKKFVGFDNFINLFTDPDKVFIQVISNSVIYMILTVVITISIGIIIAVFLNKNTRINRILQSVTFAPHIISLVSVAFIWQWIMDADYGLLNYFLNFFGIGKIDWLHNSKTALLSLVIIAVWHGIGYNALIILSSLKTIPKYIYEAADLDEGRPISIFSKITLPMISPALFFLTLMDAISAFKVFEPIALITGGGPMNSTTSLVYYIYEYGFKFNKIGYAAAAGVILFVIIGMVTIVYFIMLSKKVHYR